MLRVHKQTWDGDYQIHDNEGRVVIVPRHEMNMLARVLLNKIGLRITNTISIDPDDSC